MIDRNRNKITSTKTNETQTNPIPDVHESLIESESRAKRLQRMRSHEQNLNQINANVNPYLNSNRNKPTHVLPSF